MDKVENIGLIGYGVIGKAIAKELMKSYYHVFAYDNSESEMILAKNKVVLHAHHLRMYLLKQK